MCKSRVSERETRKKRGMVDGKKDKDRRKAGISTIFFPSIPACTILRPLHAASVSVFGTTH